MMPLSRVMLFEKVSTEDESFATVMCTYWLATDPLQFVDRAEIARPTAPLVGEYDRKLAGVLPKTEDNQIVLEQVSDRVAPAISASGRVVAVSTRRKRDETQSKKRSGPAESDSQAKRPRTSAEASVLNWATLPSQFPPATPMLMATPTQPYRTASELAASLLDEALGISTTKLPFPLQRRSALIKTDSDQLLSVIIPNGDSLSEVEVGSTIAISSGVARHEFVHRKLLQESVPGLSVAFQELISFENPATMGGEASHHFLNDSQPSDHSSQQVAHPAAKITGPFQYQPKLRLPVVLLGSYSLNSLESLPSSRIAPLIFLRDLHSCQLPLVSVAGLVVAGPLDVFRWQHHAHPGVLCLFLRDPLSVPETQIMVQISSHHERSISSLSKRMLVVVSDLRIVRNKSSLHLCTTASTTFGLLPPILSDAMSVDSSRSGTIIELNGSDHRAPQTQSVFKYRIPSIPWILVQDGAEMLRQDAFVQMAPDSYSHRSDFQLGTLLSLSRSQFEANRFLHRTVLCCKVCAAELAKVQTTLLCVPCEIKHDLDHEEVDVVEVEDFPAPSWRTTLLGAPYEFTAASQADSRWPLASAFNGVVIAVDNQRRGVRIVCLGQNE